MIHELNGSVFSSDPVNKTNDPMNPIDVHNKNYIMELKNRLSNQKGINVQFEQLSDANHFFSKSEEILKKSLNKYISKESALF